MAGVIGGGYGCRQVSLVVALILAWLVLDPPFSMIVIAGALVLEGVELYWGLRLAKRRALTGAEALIGREAEVVQRLAPQGRVTLDGERWRARLVGGGVVEPDEIVVVSAIRGLTLWVDRPVADPPTET
jgi:membrane protein implicated in regulation of membrane protease activity